MYRFNLLNSIEDIKSEFNFLITEYCFDLIEQKSTNKGVVYIYGGDELKFHFNYDYRENYFYAKLIRGKATQYPNDHDFENIKPLFHLAQKYESGFDIRKLQPDENQYIDALKLNVDILKKYGDKILKGEEWF